MCHRYVDHMEYSSENIVENERIKTPRNYIETFGRQIHNVGGGKNSVSLKNYT